MDIIHYNECPFCASSNIKKIFACKDFLVKGSFFDIYKCDNCGFRFTQDIPSLEKIGEYYKSEAYVSHSDSKKGILNKLYHIARNYMLGRKFSHIKSVTGKNSGKVLDIGAGTGYFVNYMKEKGFSPEGVELDEDARKVAKNNFGIELKPIHNIYNLPEKEFDIITMWHVLEHIHDLDGYMKSINHTLKEDGWFVCALPNFTSYDAAHYGKHWAAYDVPRHLWHFSPDFFMQFAAHYGFEVITMRAMPLDAVYISLLSQKIEGKSIIAGFLKGGIFFLKSLFNTKRASSIIYFLKKA